MPWEPLTNAFKEWRSYKDRTGQWPVRSISADIAVLFLLLVVPLATLIYGYAMRKLSPSVIVLVVVLSLIAGVGVWLFVIDWARREDMRRRSNGR